jgi:PAS domain S-box-containing protein
VNDSTTSGDPTVAQSGLQRIIRALTWIGTGFLIAAGGGLVWAVLRTQGLDDFVTALTVTGLGFGLPAVVAFVVAWMLGTFDEAEQSRRPASGVAADTAESVAITPRSPLEAVIGYAIATFAVVIALALRVWLNPLLGDQIPFVTFFLAVAVAGWVAGLGPSLLAVLLSVALAWYFFVPSRGASGATLSDIGGLGLFAAVALGIAGVTSALRIARDRARSLVQEALAARTGVEAARADLALERDRIAITLRSIADAVIAADAQGRITFMNATAEKLTAWSNSEALGKSVDKVFQVVDERNGKNVPSLVEAVLKEGKAQNVAGEAALIDRRAKQVPIDVSAAPITAEDGKVQGAVLVFRDITEERRARASLEESEARFRLMADQAPVLIWMSDTTKACTYFNRVWLEFTGRTLEEEQGNGWADGVHPEDFAHCLATYTSAFDARQPFEMEYRLRRHDGEYRWVYDRGVPRVGTDGTFEGYIGGCFDITDRKQVQEAIGRADLQRSEFLAMLAHELRNPLAPIRSAAQIMQRLGGGSDARVLHAREVIERQTGQLTRLIDDLLDISRIDSGKVKLRREVVSIQDLVQRALDSQRPSIEDRKQTLDITMPEAAVLVDADPARLTQALDNVIANASKFTPAGGRIEIKAHASDSQVELTIADSGEGIEAELLPHVFDLYGQDARAARAASGSLGLGLAIARRLIDLQDGAIEAQSAGKGKGSRFVIRLPRASATQAADKKAADAARKATILVVDDNIDAAEAIGTLLDLAGHNALLAHDPKGALEITGASPLDVVVLDIGLPGQTGYEVARQMHAQPGNADLKIVALTGYGAQDDHEQAKAAGFVGYLVKPVDSETLTSLIDDLTRGAGRASA